jgi:asparagine synthase (glutamine-hydrolysing)
MVDVLPAIARHHGEPFADPSALPCWYLAEMTRKHVTVALSGDASDEAFGGYRRYVWSHVAHRLRSLPAPVFRLAVRALMAVPGAKARWLREYGRHLTMDEAERYLRFIGHFTAEERAQVYAPELQLHVDATARRFAAICAGEGEPLGRLMYLDIHTYLPDDILTKVDIATMAHGLESRAPLVDHHVMELAARIPSSLKVHRLRGKHILKEAFRDLVPSEILDRRKKGFSLPLGRWMREDLRELAHDTLADTRARQRGLFQVPAIEHLLARHAAGEDHGDRLWNLMMLEIWFRTVVDGRAALVSASKEAATSLRQIAP